MDVTQLQVIVARQPSYNKLSYFHLKKDSKLTIAYNGKPIQNCACGNKLIPDRCLTNALVSDTNKK